MEKKNLIANHTKTERYEVPLSPPPSTPNPSYETLIKHKMTRSFGVISITLSTTTLSSKTTTQIGRNANYWEADWEQNKT